MAWQDIFWLLQGGGDKVFCECYLKSHRPLVAKARTHPVWPLRTTLSSNSGLGSSQVSMDLAAFPQKICRRLESMESGSSTMEKIGAPSGWSRNLWAVCWWSDSPSEVANCTQVHQCGVVWELTNLWARVSCPKYRFSIILAWLYLCCLSCHFLRDPNASPPASQQWAPIQTLYACYIWQQNLALMEERAKRSAYR